MFYRSHLGRFIPSPSGSVRVQFRSDSDLEGLEFQKVGSLMSFSCFLFIGVRLEPDFSPRPPFIFSLSSSSPLMCLERLFNKGFRPSLQACPFSQGYKFQMALSPLT